MQMLSPQDMPSAVLSSEQVRDFRRRALGPLASRLAFGEADWTKVAVDRELWYPDGERQRVEFLAERDDDSGDVDYTISTSVAVPFGDDWTSSAVLQRLGAANTWISDGEAEGTIIDRGGNDEEAEAAGSPAGFWGRDASYMIRIPYSRRLKPRAQTEVSFTFFDEDFDPVDGEIATNALVIPESNQLDIKRLLQFGETMLVQETAEADLITMTEYDAVFVLNLLKSMGLVRRTCKPFSDLPRGAR